MTERKAALRKFNEGDSQILIATDVASRGLDLPDVTHVYNFDMPANAAIYVHRAGRTARAGAKGVVTTLVLANEISFIEKLERYTQKDIEKRAIKNVCAAFPVNGGKQKNPSEKKPLPGLSPPVFPAESSLRCLYKKMFSLSGTVLECFCRSPPFRSEAPQESLTQNGTPLKTSSRPAPCAFSRW